MTKTETLYRAGYKAAQPIETLPATYESVEGESMSETSERISKIETARGRGWEFIRYALNIPDTLNNFYKFNLGFTDRMTGKGYRFNK